jgi:hypothetical protein
LEKWLQQKEGEFRPEWQRISSQSYYVTGARAYSSRRTPEIYQLAPILNDVVRHLGDTNIAKLVHVLRDGSRKEQRQMVEEIIDHHFNELTK